MNNYDTTRPFGNGSTCAQALVNSVNSVFCNIGKDLGAKLIVEYAKRFGFYEIPPLETPDERAGGERALQGRRGSSTPRSTRTSTPAGSPSARSDCS